MEVFKIKEGEQPIEAEKATKLVYYFSQDINAVVCRESDKWFYFVGSEEPYNSISDPNLWKYCKSPPSGSLLCRVSKNSKNKNSPAAPTVVEPGRGESAKANLHHNQRMKEHRAWETIRV